MDFLHDGDEASRRLCRRARRRRMLVPVPFGGVEYLIAARCNRVPALRGTQMTAGPTHRTTAETAATHGPVIYVVDDDKAIRLALSTMGASHARWVEAFVASNKFLACC